MAITPLDIQNKEFKIQWVRGYNRDEVDEFLDMLIREFEALIKENVSYREQIESLTARLEHFQQLEDTLNRTLVVAQETADEVRANARKEAELTIQEARLQAERIVEGGQHKVQRLLQEYDELKKQAMALRSQLRAMLKAQLDTLDRTLPGGEPEVAAMPGENTT